MEQRTNRFVNERAVSPVQENSERSTTPELPAPYRVCTERLTRLERLIETFVDASVNSAARENSNRAVLGAVNCLPEFRPGDPTMTSVKWVTKIDQLAILNGWSENTIIFQMQNKLGGLARSWFNSLTNYDLTWGEWKDLLIKTFPEHHDFAAVLRRQINRSKLPWETWEKYYFEKIELIRACEISDRNAVSCIIDGINNKTIQTGAKAGRYNTPEALYSEYLSTLPNDEVRDPSERKVQTFPGTSKSSNLHGSYGHDHRNKRMDDKKKNIKCYNCRGQGHSYVQCKKPKLECTNCNRLGHTSDKCFRSAKSNCVTTSSDQKCYYVECSVNGQKMTGYVDPGCSAVIIKQSAADKLGVSLQPCSTVIRGYGNSFTRVIGQCKVVIEVDLAKCEVEAIIVEDDVQGVDVMIGQPFINSSGVTTVIKGSMVRLVPDNVLPLPEVEQLPPAKLSLRATRTSIVPPKSVAHIPVDGTTSGYTGDVYVEAQVRPEPGKENILIRCITTCNNGFVSLLNMSSSRIKINKSQVVARGVPCVEDNLTINERDIAKIFQTKLYQPFEMTQIETQVNKDISESDKAKLQNLLNNYRECFAENTAELGTSNITKMQIRLTDDKPLKKVIPFLI